MSASAPLGKPSKKTGKVEAVCTKATQMGELVKDVIIQAAATSFIHIQMLAVTQVPHSRRKTGILSGDHAEAGTSGLRVFRPSISGGSVGSSGMSGVGVVV